MTKRKQKPKPPQITGPFIPLSDALNKSKKLYLGEVQPTTEDDWLERREAFSNEGELPPDHLEDRE